MIREIGRSVILQACEQASQWHRQHKDLTVSVNVSVFQLRTDEFISDVRDALECSGLNPARLVLEITESILINNPETALRRLRVLKGLGVRLAIDDFGTGYSSLSYLRQFPFDILKIDHSFIGSMADSPQAATMVRTMIELGRRLKLEVVAEGVENEQQLDLLRRLHCHYVQGYRFWQPIDADAMTSLLSEWPDRGLEPQGGSATIARRARLRRSSSPSAPAITPEMPHTVPSALGESSEPRQRPGRGARAS
jgi:EAL domain-containing protein (putative c-di-GMP-specific phosphodiesterase class I)